MVATRLNQCTAYQRLDRGGGNFSFKDYCFDNLVKYIISAFLEHYESVPFFATPAVELLVYSDFHNKK